MSQRCRSQICPIAAPLAGPSHQAAPGRGGPDIPAKKRVPHPNPKVAIGHLPQPGKHFVGRDDELELLDEAWENPRTNIVEFVAFGGVGKSALVAEWLKRMLRDGWRGAARVFGHSFYSQGSREDAQASADSFLDQALRFFGDPDPTQGSPWDKGERLSGLVREQTTLLILDGVEPLQSAGVAADAGQIRDPGLQALVRELATGMNGLLVISSRAQVADIEGWEGSSVQRHALDHLSVAAGSVLLRQIGVTGSDEEIAAAVWEVDGHALAINLLGTFVCHARSGKIADRHDIGLRQIGQTMAPDAGAQRNPTHTAATFTRIMKRYELWLAGLEIRGGDVDKSGQLALEILRLTGLFDRPITAGEFAALLGSRNSKASNQLLTPSATEPIPRLTDSAGVASEDAVNLAVRNLVNYGLITKLTTSALKLDIPPWPDSTGGEALLDAHPLVRDHFAVLLAEHFANATCEAHRRLYEHLVNSAPTFPNDLSGMTPLYHAVAHGCKADRAQEAFQSVYKRRIQRDEDFFRWRTIGSAFQDELLITRFVDDIGDARLRAYLLEIQGGVRRGLGLTNAAADSVRKSCTIYHSLGDTVRASYVCSFLAEILISTGRLQRAESAAQASVGLSQKSPVSNVDVRANALRSLGNVFHQRGRFDDAEKAFSQANEMNSHLGATLHASPVNCRYHEFRLDQLESMSSRQVAIKEAANIIHSLENSVLVNASELAKGMAKYIIGRARLLLFVITGDRTEVMIAKQCLTESILTLRSAEMRDHIPRALILRSRITRLAGDKTDSRLDLDRAWTLIEQGSLRLFEVDYYLEMARLYVSINDFELARDALATACHRIAHFGYFRRETDCRSLDREVFNGSICKTILGPDS